MRRAIAATLTVPVLVVLLSPRQVAAQTASMRVSLPSPTAASLGKFGDIPVSLYTGVPDISIPLFTVKGRTLELPIVLRYHARGIRVEEIGGWVGIGWTLEAGGSIARTVRGLEDQTVGGYYNRGYIFYDDLNWPSPPTSILDQIAEEFLDSEPDQYFYSFAGRSGQFVMGPTSTSTTLKEVRTVPYQKLRIEPGPDFDSFVITSEDGTSYAFTAVETTTDIIGGSADGPYASSWHLTQIRSVGGDTITLYYTPYSAHHRVGAWAEDFHYVVCNGSGCACDPTDDNGWNDYRVEAQRLDSIKAAAHTLHFTAAARADALSPSGASQEPRLEKITVTTPTGAVLRVLQLTHDYSTGRLTLASVSEKDRQGGSLPPHSFKYAAPGLPAHLSASQDHWGYYNGRANSSGLLPKIIAPNGTVIPGADRRPDSAFMKAGILTKITYPTGGYNEFVYEPNDYWGSGEGPVKSTELSSPPQSNSQSTTFTVGGLEKVVGRVQVAYTSCTTPCPMVELGQHRWQLPGVYEVSLVPGITYTLRIGPTDAESVYARVEWREYVSMNVPGGGLRAAEIRAVGAMQAPGDTTIRRYTYALQSDPTRSSGRLNDKPVYGSQHNSSSCSWFSRSSMSKVPLGGGPSVGYGEVTVWHGASGEYGKTRHEFENSRADLVSDGAWPFSRRTSYEWARGQPRNVAEYSAGVRLRRMRHRAMLFKN